MPIFPDGDISSWATHLGTGHHGYAETYKFGPYILRKFAQPEEMEAVEHLRSLGVPHVPLTPIVHEGRTLLLGPFLEGYTPLAKTPKRILRNIPIDHAARVVAAEHSMRFSKYPHLRLQDRHSSNYLVSPTGHEVVSIDHDINRGGKLPHVGGLSRVMAALHGDAWKHRLEAAVG